MSKGFAKIREGCYAARLHHQGKRYHLGTFKTEDEAKACYKEALEKFEIKPGKPGRKPQPSLSKLERVFEANKERLSAQDRTIRLLDRKMDFLNNLVRSLQKRVETLEQSR